MLVATITYSNAPEFGAQFATIELRETGYAVVLHFREKRYNCTTQQDEPSLHTFDYAGHLRGAHYSMEELVKLAQAGLDKYAYRAGYRGKMEYTVTEPQQYTVVRRDLVTDEEQVLATATEQDARTRYAQEVQAYKASDVRSNECAAMLVDGSIMLALKDANGNIVAALYSDESSEPVDRYAAKYGQPAPEQLTPEAQQAVNEMSAVLAAISTPNFFGKAIKAVAFACLTVASLASCTVDRMTTYGYGLELTEEQAARFDNGETITVHHFGMCGGFGICENDRETCSTEHYTVSQTTAPTKAR
ncbi:hypothetical protein [Hymenobacter koreensis]|uniref:KTSC domain-containing protein n=1 Tax=Hymenobacter koreensis TaxID=1084523 RepID=A0ABP8JJG8_9BACT